MLMMLTVDAVNAEKPIREDEKYHYVFTINRSSIDYFIENPDVIKKGDRLRLTSDRKRNEKLIYCKLNTVYLDDYGSNAFCIYNGTPFKRIMIFDYSAEEFFLESP